MSETDESAQPRGEPSQPSGPDQIRRLERRYKRERRARIEAEEIAEEGMRSLYAANQELDQRIAQRTIELQHALEAAEAASNAKSAFLAQMSHQINTPLNGLMGLLELLATEMHDPQSKEWHAAALRSAQRLERMTTRLAKYVSLEGADIRIGAPVRPLGDVLSAAHDRWHAQCLRAAQLLTVDLETDRLLISAPPQLDLLLDELLSNAVEHAGPGSVVLSGRSVDDDHIRIELADPGPGLDEDDLERVKHLDAEPNQAQRADAEIHLGLALVERIVTALGGSWSAVTANGAAVAVTFPPPAAD